jgi:hypothetical protein
MKWQKLNKLKLLKQEKSVKERLYRCENLRNLMTSIFSNFGCRGGQLKLATFGRSLIGAGELTTDQSAT